MSRGVAPDSEGIRRLIGDIEAEARFAREYTGRSGFDPRVLDALATVPRHAFVPEDVRGYAYENRPLPIGHGQTISQPYIVALMTDLLEVGPEACVLEVGTGCGYQTAVLAELVTEVYTIERVEPLGRAAADRLQRLGYGNVHTRIGDGYGGWPEAAPFGGILVTAAAAEIPQPLMEQLAPGARLVVPVGEGGYQSLKVVTRDAQGGADIRSVLPVAFVPLVHSRDLS